MNFEVYPLLIAQKNVGYGIFLDNLYSTRQYLTFVMPLVTLFNTLKHHKTRYFLMFSGEV